MKEENWNELLYLHCRSPFRIVCCRALGADHTGWTLHGELHGWQAGHLNEKERKKKDDYYPEFNSSLHA